MGKFNITGEYFFGNKISSYGLEHGYVDYATLAKSFDAVMNNTIIANTQEIGYWECVSGSEGEFYTNADGDVIDTWEYEQLDEDEQANYDYEYNEVFQWFIVSDCGAKILQNADEIVYYNEVLDMYVWGVTHCGTSWDYVLTDIPCNTGKSK